MEKNKNKLEGKAEPSPAELEQKATVLRENVTDIVSELDHRRQAMFDWRAQLQKHQSLLIGVGGVAVLLIGGIATIAGVRSRHARRPLTRARNFNRAMQRIADDPKHVIAPAPSLGMKVLSAVLTTLAGVVVRAIAQRVVDQTGTIERPPPRAEIAPPMPSV